MNRFYALILWFVASAAAFAGDLTRDAQVKALRATLQKQLPNTTITSIEESSVPGIYEVWMGQNVAFVSPASPTFFIVGRVIDTSSMTDITGPKLAAARGATAKTESSQVDRIDVQSLPVNDALKKVHGNGKRTLYVFSDPSCGYCRRLEPELARLQDATVYTFVVPFQGASVPQAVLCSPDPQRTWDAVMAGGNAPAAVPAPCSTPLDRNLVLARRLGVSGTPTIFYADGTRTSGYVQVQELERRIAATSSPQRISAPSVANTAPTGEQR